MEEKNIKSIWEQVIEYKANDEEKEVGPSGEKVSVGREANFLFVGPRSSGKSTLVQAYITKDKTDKPSPTTALNYKYTRSSAKMSMDNDLTHFWEVGGGRPMVSLLDIALSKSKIADSLVVVAVDLSRAGTLIAELEYWLKAVRARAETCLASLAGDGSTLPDALKAKAQDVFNASASSSGGHSDINRVKLMPVPCLIVGCKYDRVKDIEAERLKVMSKALRSVAHQNGCSLLYTSIKAKTLMQTFRSRISRHVLNKEQSKTLQIDHTKPLSVPAGMDSFSNIGHAPAGDWLSTYTQLFPADEVLGRQPSSSSAAAADNNVNLEIKLRPEPVVDAMLTQKDEELRRARMKAELTRNMNALDSNGLGGGRGNASGSSRGRAK